MEALRTRLWFVAAAALAAHAPALALEARSTTIEFGDDSSQWALDDECDDPRFVGSGMAQVLNPEDIARDASDCRDAFRQGRIDTVPMFLPVSHPSQIIWGDDAGERALDGACADARFTGYYGAAAAFLVEHVGHDASDCRKLFLSGRARLRDAFLTNS